MELHRGDDDSRGERQPGGLVFHECAAVQLPYTVICGRGILLDGDPDRVRAQRLPQPRLGSRRKLVAIVIIATPWSAPRAVGSEDQNESFSANWICRDGVAVR